MQRSRWKCSKCGGDLKSSSVKEIEGVVVRSRSCSACGFRKKFYEMDSETLGQIGRSVILDFVPQLKAIEDLVAAIEMINRPKQAENSINRSSSDFSAKSLGFRLVNSLGNAENDEEQFESENDERSSQAS